MKHKKPLKITSRTSTVTNAFVQAILPDTPPTPREREELLSVLGYDPTVVSCVYCGDGATDWDHLNPLVKNKLPTGHLTHFRNLVPACGKCNQSKGGQCWRAWMVGPATNSPKSRGVANLDQRIANLEKFERWAKNEPLNLEQLVSGTMWNNYWAKLDHIIDLMNAAQVDANKIRALLTQSMSSPTQQ